MFFTLKSVPDHLAVPIDRHSASPDDPFALHAPLARKTAVAVCSSPSSSSRPPPCSAVIITRANKLTNRREEEEEARDRRMDSLQDTSLISKHSHNLLLWRRSYSTVCLICWEVKNRQIASLMQDGLTWTYLFTDIARGSYCSSFIEAEVWTIASKLNLHLGDYRQVWQGNDRARRPTQSWVGKSSARLRETSQGKCRNSRTKELAPRPRRGRAWAQSNITLAVREGEREGEMMFAFWSG